MSSWPQQDRNISPGDAASAPYNFVPLPEAVVPAAEAPDDLPGHDTYDPARHTGHFDVTLTTRSPLYIRAPLTVEEFEQQNGDKPEFFYTRDEETPVVPGTSLQGMLRGLVEIASYGTMERVTEEPLFYRTMGRSSLSNHYTDKLGGNVETGFLRKKRGQYVIKTCEMVRVPRCVLEEFGSLYQGSGPNKTPHWNGDCHQWKNVWVRRGGKRKRIAGQPKSSSEWDEGRLVITGDFPGKEEEFIFFLPDSDSEMLPVPKELIDRFHDDNQITQWQEDAFPRNQPEQGCRERDGMFRRDPASPGDPVFFLREDEDLSFLGRAQMFRLPYENRPVDMVPGELRDRELLDYADALFGYTRGDQDSKGKDSAYAGRISVSSAHLEDGQNDIWYADAPIEPSVLSSPKPTCFQHYLVQDTDDIKQLKHYDSRPSEDTIIRGHKLYWHDWREGDRSIPKDPEASSTQKTQFKPVDSGVRFSWRLDFENLSGAELGALCWALHPQGDPEKEYYHKLGMGKPLGMGSVELDAKLHLDDRTERYESLFGDHSWAMGEKHGGIQSDADRFQGFVSRFEKDVLEKLTSAGVDFAEEADRLRDLGRIGILLKMMEWPGPSSDTEYMGLKKFRDRPVLASPAEYGELTGYEGIEGPSAASGDRAINFDARQSGTVKRFDDDKGYGFIGPDEGCVSPGDGDVFVHHSDIKASGYQTLEEGDRVAYDVEETKKGLKALDVERTGS
ncbi:MAG: TIGR03986 family CRISPR-associated RAMP protein [Salinibacter sp.]